ncbi:serpin B3 [Halyomorpha halys]|uniref:serpin B3 n=1 Tax=Halyomorpha halys TaxID=286706 RepID=UPI0006D4D67B
MDMKYHELRNKFALDLYQELSKLSSQNIIVSPAGLKILLTTLLHGARGVTAAEIAKVIYFPEYKKYFVDSKTLIPDLEKHLLTLKTLIFIEKSYSISSDFRSFIKRFLSSEIHEVDFKNHPGSVEEINGWIAKSTNQKINGLLSFESMSKVTSLVLVSTVFLKPHCKYKFQKNETVTTIPFYVKPNLIVDAEMMILREKRFCTMKSRALDAQIIEVPFAENKLNMIIILPKKLDGLEDIESKLGSVDLYGELSQLWLSKVNLYLPKFKLEQTTEMNEILSKIGMPTAFTDKANFSGISLSGSLTITHVIHKALIEVQETGIEACEETEPNSYGRAPLKALTEVKCDHPFLFIILAQREVLFIGRLQNPNEK